MGISSFPALFFAFVVILAHLESAADAWTANNVAICDEENRLGLAFRPSGISFPLIEQLESRFHRGSNVSFYETEKNSSFHFFFAEALLTPHGWLFDYYSTIF